jgi:hypothetical protein
MWYGVGGWQMGDLSTGSCSMLSSTSCPSGSWTCGGSTGQTTTTTANYVTTIPPKNTSTTWYGGYTTTSTTEAGCVDCDNGAWQTNPEYGISFFDEAGCNDYYDCDSGP